MVDRGRVKLPLAACKAAVLIVITIGPLKFILKHCLLHYKQTRQRYLYLLSSTNLPFGWWTLTNRRPTNSLMELLFPELKAHYRLMLDSKKNYFFPRFFPFYGMKFFTYFLHCYTWLLVVDSNHGLSH